MRCLWHEGTTPRGHKAPLPPLTPPCLQNGAAAPAAKRARLPARPTAIVLDIEGTVAPISFVAEKLFPYAAAHVASHLEAHYDSEEGQEDVEAIRQQVMVVVM